MIRLVDNPYENASFDPEHHRIGEVHRHNNYSDFGEPAEVIDEYHDIGYEVLCVSGRTSWRDDEGNYPHPYPWDDMAPTTISEANVPDDWTENRDPEELGMIAIQGFEDTLTDPNHWFFYFTDYNAADYEFPNNKRDRAYEGIESAEDALVMSPHSGRYVESDKNGDWAEGEWREITLPYDYFFRSMPRFVGLEAFNGGLDRGCDDRLLWDDILKHYTPQRQVVGFGADDDRTDVGQTVFLMDDEEFEAGHETGDIYRVMTEGQSYVTGIRANDTESAGHMTLENVEHDEENQEITVTVEEDYDHVNWRSGRNTIHDGETLYYGEKRDEIHGYARCEFVIGENVYPNDEEHPPESILSTQAFRFTTDVMRAQP